MSAYLLYTTPKLYIHKFSKNFLCLLVPANPLYLPIPSLNNPSAYPLEKYRMAISASGLEA